MIEAIVEILGELLLQLVLEVLAEVGLHAVREPLRARPNPALAATGYLLFGLAAGALSLLVAPHSFVHGDARLLNLVLAPLLAGLAMRALGAWRTRRGQAVVRLDRFLYGYLFAVALAIVRFQFAR